MFSQSVFNQVNYKNLKPVDVLSIQKDSNTPFHYIYIQRPNFIIKRAAIANYKALDVMKVKIEEISQKSTVKFVLLNGKKFLRYFQILRTIYKKRWIAMNRDYSVLRINLKVPREVWLDLYMPFE